MFQSFKFWKKSEENYYFNMLAYDMIYEKRTREINDALVNARLSETSDAHQKLC